MLSAVGVKDTTGNLMLAGIVKGKTILYRIYLLDNRIGGDSIND